MYRSYVTVCLASAIGIVSAIQAAGQQACRPALAVGHVELSPMRPPTLERKWTAVVSVDASGCATNSQGHFDIVFSRLKETGPDIEFRQRFMWRTPSVTVEVDFWADEAVQGYWLDNVAPCPCGD
jgi:hypothetical protein